MLGHSVRLLPLLVQSLSELERARLQEVALWRLEERDLDLKICIPKETTKRRKSLRRKFDSFSKEKKDRESAPRVFGLPLSQVIGNDRAHRRRQDELRQSRRDCLELEASVLRFRAQKRALFSGSRPLIGPSFCGPPGSPSANSVAPEPLCDKPLSPTFKDNSGRGQRRGGLSVDSISDLVESQSRLLEALQLSHPAELDPKRQQETSRGRNAPKLSLNPIYRQVPRLVESCCHCIETHGLHTVGIFRVGSSKKRVRQLREEFDSGLDVRLDDEQSVHDVAALLKEFLRDMPDPLLPRELYPAFLHATALGGADQISFLQLLLFLLPPCNCDTLWRLLSMLHRVQSHAHDSATPTGEQIAGNKMTAPNLAVIFGPNLLQKERSSESPLGVNIEDSSAIIRTTLVLIQNYRELFTVSAELQQDVLMSLIQTDPDIIDYLLRRKLSSVPLSPSLSSSSSGRHGDGSSLDSVGGSSGSSSPQESPSAAFPPDCTSSEGRERRRGEERGERDRSDILLKAIRLNQSRRRHREIHTGLEAPVKSISHMRQFHSHHNLLSLTLSPSSSPSHPSPPASPRAQPEERSVWIRDRTRDQTTNQTTDHTTDQTRDQTTHQTTDHTTDQTTDQTTHQTTDQTTHQTTDQTTHQTTDHTTDHTKDQTTDQNKTTENFWDFFSGKSSSSETMV